MSIDYGSLIFGLLRRNAPDLSAVEQALGIGKAAALVDPIEKIVSSYASGGLKAVLKSNGAELAAIMDNVAPHVAQVAPNLANILTTVAEIEPSLTKLQAPDVVKEVVAALRGAGGDLQTVIQAAAPVVSKVAPNLSNILSAAQSSPVQSSQTG